MRLLGQELSAKLAVASGIRLWISPWKTTPHIGQFIPDSMGRESLSEIQLIRSCGNLSHVPVVVQIM